MLKQIKDQEIERFVQLVLRVHEEGKNNRSVFIGCDGPQAARKIRRRFYLLRNKLDFEPRLLAHRVTFRLQGARIECKPLETLSSLEPEDVRNTEDEVSGSDRLDDSSGIPGVPN